MKTSLGQVDSQLAALELELDERERLVTVLQLAPSANDNLDIISHFTRLVTQLTAAREDVAPGNKLAQAEFDARFERYRRCYTRLRSDAYIDVSEYDLHFESWPAAGPPPASKSVRFHDDADAMRSDLMGTRAFKPYRDDDGDSAQSDSGDAVSLGSASNHQLFADHQQQLLDQDDQLDTLHDSVRRQHAMGVSINDEVDDHIILLSDLELGVESAQQRLHRAGQRLRRFRQTCRENGSLVTIVVLTVILILLLVVLN